MAAGLGAFTGIGFIVALVCAIFLAVYWEAFKKHGPFYCSLIIGGVCFFFFLSYIYIIGLINY